MGEVLWANEAASLSASPCGSGWEGGRGVIGLEIDLSFFQMLPSLEWAPRERHHSSHFCSLMSVFSTVECLTTAWR